MPCGRSAGFTFPWGSGYTAAGSTWAKRLSPTREPVGHDRRLPAVRTGQRHRGFSHVRAYRDREPGIHSSNRSSRIRSPACFSGRAPMISAWRFKSRYSVSSGVPVTLIPWEAPETFEPFLDPGFYFCRANVDGRAPAAPGRADPLPRNVSIGVHVNTGLRTRIGWRAYSLFSLKWAHEMSDLLVRKTGRNLGHGIRSGRHRFFRQRHPRKVQPPRDFEAGL